MRGLHYAWLILACAFLALTISNGLSLGGLTVFDERLLEEFGWSVGALKFRDFLTFAIAGLAGPFAGKLAERQGVRPLMVVGSLLLAAGLLGYSQITHIVHVYAIHVAFGIALACAGLVVNVLIVSRWFQEKRGTAIGLALVGTSLGNIVFAKSNTWLLSMFDWREAFLIVGSVPIVLIPLAVFVIREWPADRGLLPFGAKAPAEAAEATSKSPRLEGVEYGEALRSRDFWLIAIAAMTTFYVVLAAASHLFLHLRGQGFTPAEASSGIALLFGLGLIGKFALGMLSDFFDPKKVFVVGVAMMLAGSLCLASMSQQLYWPFLVLLGLGWGGLYTMLQLLTVQRFGLRAAGRILGTITVLDAIGGGLGMFLTGVLRDVTGGYQLPFVVMCGLLVVALGCAVAMRAPERPKIAAPALGTQ